jgi:NTP pyrophosphatase (non-canonical NTP hydrolase)
MTVTIPASENHNGMDVITVTISDYCPVCFMPRGKPYKALSYDGSRSVEVDGWNNPCGHIDTYERVRFEASGLPTICIGINVSAQRIHEINKDKGFWDKERNVGELLMLVTSELGEAMEAHRKGRHTTSGSVGVPLTNQEFETHVKDTFEDEIADAVIRLLDMAAGLGIDLEWQIRAKVGYNLTREKLHGKLY